MANTIANVLTGVATLGIRYPNDGLAEWSMTQIHDGTHSVRLWKGTRAVYGSTHLRCLPTVATGGTITLGLWNTEMQAVGNYSFWYFNETTSVANVNWLQISFVFEDPNSNGNALVVALPFHGLVGTNLWTPYDLVTVPAPVGYQMTNELGTDTSDFGLGFTVSDIRDQIGADSEGGLAASADDWELTEIRFELWESYGVIERATYLSDMVLHSNPYTVEPGGTLPGMSLSSPFTDIGYTEDGVTIEYTADTADIEVEEETFPIDRVITKETVAVTCNMAESSLYNIDKAMAGSLLSGSILKLGAGTMKTMNLKIAGINPAGFNREILIPLATSTGAVGMSYKKDEKTVVPVTFQALKGDEPAVTIVDNTV